MFSLNAASPVAEFKFLACHLYKIAAFINGSHLNQAVFHLAAVSARIHINSAADRPWNAAGEFKPREFMLQCKSGCIDNRCAAFSDERAAFHSNIVQF